MSKLLYIFFANVFFSSPSFFLVIIYSHFGSLGDSALLGISFAVCAPVQLFFSMQHGISILGNKLDYKLAFLTRLSMVAPFIIIGCAFSVYFSSIIVLFFFLARLADFLYEPFLYERFRAGPTLGMTVEVGVRFVGIALIVYLSVHLGLGLTWCLLGIFFYSIFFVAFGLSKVSRWENKKWVSGMGLYSGVVPLIASVLVNLPRYFLFAEEEVVIAFYSNMLTLVMGGSLVYVAFNNFFFSRNAARGEVGVVRFLDGTASLFLMGLLLSSFFYFFEGFLSLAFVSFFLGEKYIDYHGLVFGFAVTYFIFYFHSAVNCVFVFMGLERIYLLFLLVYFSSLFIGFLFFFNGDIGVLVWMVNAIGLAFGLLFFVFLRLKLKES